MTRQADAQKKISAFPSTGSGFSLAGKANALSLVHAFRNLDLITFHLVGIPTPQRDRALRSVERFFERNQNVRFDIAAAYVSRWSLAKRTAAAETCLAAAAEKRLEEIAETSPTEFEVNAAAIARRIPLEPAARLRAPARRRLKAAARLVPICAQLVVFLPLFRITENFVGFVDLLELLFRRRLVLVDVGMIFARQLPERFANLIVARRFRNAQGVVIISKLNRHVSGKVSMGSAAAQPQYRRACVIWAGCWPFSAGSS